MKFKQLAINHTDDLIFGKTINPVTSGRGLVFGGGIVYPEVNFTVPAGTVINRETLHTLGSDYADAVRGILQRGVDLSCPGLTIEFETLLEMTMDPVIGTELTARMNEVCEEYFQKYGFKSEIRLTPNDSRDFDRPPLMRTSSHLENMYKLFNNGAAAGGNLLSIESTGGKEICDEALMMCDLRGVIFSMAVLGVRDMKMLWREIVKIAHANGRIAGGDTACGFGNTAMVLAEKKYIPHTFAAIVRIATVVRSLIAIEEGATGPDKDCGYEGVYLKAIAGIPISMEGKIAACAHLSPVGNVASACADLWSNESIQNFKLLGGMAPTVCTEQLEYDCRLMNLATRKGKQAALQYRDLLVESDTGLDPQALVLAPESVITIASEIVKGENYLDATIRGCTKAVEVIETAVADGRLTITEREDGWLTTIREELASIPKDESKFIDEMLPTLDPTRFIASEYGL